MQAGMACYSNFLGSDSFFLSTIQNSKLPILFLGRPLPETADNLEPANNCSNFAQCTGTTSGGDLRQSCPILDFSGILLIVFLDNWINFAMKYFT
jgi:hypothetical protein